MKVGTVLINESESPRQLFGVQKGIIRWLSRHPQTGLISTVQQTSNPRFPVGALSLLSGKPVEHALVSSDEAFVKSIPPQDYLAAMEQVEATEWPPIQPVEIFSVLYPILTTLPFKLPSNVLVAYYLTDLFEALQPMVDVSEDDLNALREKYQGKLLLSLCSYDESLYGLDLIKATDHEIRLLSRLSRKLPLRFVGTVNEVDVKGMDVCRFVEDRLSLKFSGKQLSVKESSESALLTLYSQDSVIIEPYKAYSSSDLAVALLVISARALQISPRIQRLERSAKIIHSSKDQISLRTELSILAPLTELRVIPAKSTYRTLIIDRKPFLAPHPFEQDGSLCLWQPWEGLKFYVTDPRGSQANPLMVSLAELPTSVVDIYLLSPDPNSNKQRFGFRWFYPEILRHRFSLTIILLSSLCIQLLQLANPLLIQQIIDLVLGQRSLSTLYSYGSILIVLALFQSTITGLRGLLFVETTNRIDIRIGTKIIDHLLRLPISYFDKRPVGEVSTRIGELENIRSFLTGQALTVFLDVLFSIVYIIVMIVYSVPLTIAALCTIPFSILLAVIYSPIIKGKIDERAVSSAKTSSFLVEHINGMMTVKSQNIEDLTRIGWRKRYVEFVQNGFELASIGAVIGELNNFLNTLSAILVIFVGATLVISGKLTVGQLIAFRIISGYVTAPIMRLSTLWQSFQELTVSIQRLADVVETKSESQAQPSSFLLPKVTGKVELRNVSFKYPDTSTVVVKRISLEINPGDFVGVVGSSGSGKSTLMKLLPLIYRPSGGSIFIDGFDIEKVDLDSLRSQIGIVPQDPLLFQGSVWDNLTVTNRNLSESQVEAAVRAAEAYEFIMDLPNGFDTDVGERGGRLSGGQRQRIAIARALLSDPSVLILDEATSALDYRTESLVCRNLFNYLSNKTVFFVTHRLATIRPADSIIMMDKGIIAEFGSYNELIARQGLFYSLVSCQNKDGLTS